VTSRFKCVGIRRETDAVARELTRVDLDVLFDQSAKALLLFFRRRGVENVAEDLMSTVFLEAWRCRANAFIVEGSFTPWLFGIAGNILRTQRRTLKRHDAALRRYATGWTDIADDDLDRVLDRLGAQQQMPHVREALLLLSRKDREVADACLVDGLSPTEAAGLLRLPVGTVKSRLAHARAALRSVLHSSEFATLTDPESTSGHVQQQRQRASRGAGVT
jgi:RNA polymerase sigma factor (sigma-70 family)